MAEAKIVLTAEDRTRAAIESAKRNLTGLGDYATSQGLRMSGALGLFASGAVVGAVATMVRQVTNGVDKFNDLKDATGASIENLSGLEDVALRTGTSFDTMGTALIKFNSALKDEDGKNSNVFKALGLDMAALKALDPAVALQEVAKAMAGFADDGNKARAAQVLFGKSLREVAPFLKDLAEAGQLNAKVTAQQAEEAEKFNKRIFELQKNVLDLSRTVAGAAVNSMDALIARFNLGQKEGESFLTTLLKITSPLAQMLGLSGPKNGYTEARQELERIEKLLSKMDTSRKNDIGIQSLVRERERLRMQMEGYLSSGAGAGRGIVGYGPQPRMSLDIPADDKTGDSATKKAAAEAAREAAERAKLLAELNGLSGSFAEDWARLNALYKDRTISLKDLTAAQAALLAKQPAIRAANDADKKQQEEIAKIQQAADAAYTRHIQAVLAENEAKAKANQATAREIEEIGLNKEAVDMLRLARLDANIAREQEALLYAGNNALGAQEIAQIERRIELLKEERGLAQQRTVKTKVAEEKLKIENLEKDIATSMSRGLAQGLREGKNPAEAFAQTLGDVVMNKLSQSVADALLNAVGFGKDGFFTQALGGIFGGLFKLENGGIMSAAGSMPLKTYSSGGIANSPQLALYGEGRMPEAYVPLPDGRSIPVTMQGGGGGGGGDNIVVNINVNVGDIANKSDVVAGMQAVRAQMISDLRRAQTYGGG